MTTTDSVRSTGFRDSINPAPTRPGSSTSSTFDRELADALAESLTKLGKTSGDIRIEVRNAENPAQRQIVITVPAAAAEGVTGTTPSEPSLETETRVVGNPFSAPSPALSPEEAAKQSARLAEPKETAWSPYNGPCDSRDAIPAGGGVLTAAGSPKIVENASSTRNQYDYAGPAAKNPYFTHPGNPLREGYVLGFNNWFQTAAILGPDQKATPANPTCFATEEGGQEALRLVQEYEPGAQLTSRAWGGGPFLSNQPMFFVTLPNGKELNAGGILDGYYNRGTGVPVSADAELERSVRLA